MDRDIRGLNRTTGIITILLIAAVFLSGCRRTGTENKIPSATEKAESKSSFIQSTLFSNTLNLDWTYEIYLPAGYYEAPEKTYAVFFLLHGVYGSAGNWRTAAGLFTSADELAKQIRKEFIIVAMDGMNSFYIDKNIPMESAIINDLMPFMKENYRIADSKEDTFIGGISMGGYGAARIALKYPEKFGGAILLSPAVWEEPGPENGDLIYQKMGIFQTKDGGFDREAWESYHPDALIDTYKSQNSPVRFYVSTGDSDEIVKIENVDAFVSKLQTAADVKYVVKKDMNHGWALWKEEILEGIKFCLNE